MTDSLLHLLDGAYAGRKAKIIGNHPHNGATCTYVKCEKTDVGWGLVFYNLNSSEDFLVFEQNNVEWQD